MGRSILAAILGVVVGGIVVGIVESIGHLVYPPPPGLDPMNVEAVKAAMANAPTGALLFVILAWAAGALAGGCLAAWMARRANTIHAMIVGALLMAAGIWTMLTIPHPLWFWILGLAVFLPSAFAGARLAPRRQIDKDTVA